MKKSYQEKKHTQINNYMFQLRSSIHQSQEKDKERLQKQIDTLEKRVWIVRVIFAILFALSIGATVTLHILSRTVPNLERAANMTTATSFPSELALYQAFVAPMQAKIDKLDTSMQLITINQDNYIKSISQDISKETQALTKSITQKRKDK